MPWLILRFFSVVMTWICLYSSEGTPQATADGTMELYLCPCHSDSNMMGAGSWLKASRVTYTICTLKQFLVFSNTHHISILPAPHCLKHKEAVPLVSAALNPWLCHSAQF